MTLPSADSALGQLMATAACAGASSKAARCASAMQSSPCKIELDDMMTRGHCILSHGFESGPDATKVTALAEAAQRSGWSCDRPDYTDLDARREVSELGDVPARLQRLLGLAQVAASRGPVVLAGSSLGAYISALASLQVPVAGLFLMAPPLRMGSSQPLQAARVPTSIVHGWDDELIPAAHVVDWAHARRARLLLVDDSHRLSGHVRASADAFAQLLAVV